MSYDFKYTKMLILTQKHQICVVWQLRHHFVRRVIYQVTRQRGTYDGDLRRADVCVVIPVCVVADQTYTQNGKRGKGRYLSAIYVVGHTAVGNFHIPVQSERSVQRAENVARRRRNFLRNGRNMAVRNYYFAFVVMIGS